jgi:hypothetical protein
VRRRKAGGFKSLPLLALNVVDLVDNSLWIMNGQTYALEGWAYLRINGQLRGRAVTGTGRIPFVLAKRRVISPALRVVVENSVTLEDSPSSAVVHDRSGHIDAHALNEDR